MGNDVGRHPARRASVACRGEGGTPGPSLGLGSCQLILELWQPLGLVGSTWGHISASPRQRPGSSGWHSACSPSAETGGIVTIVCHRCVAGPGSHHAHLMAHLMVPTCSPMMHWPTFLVAPSKFHCCCSECFMPTSTLLCSPFVLPSRPEPDRTPAPASRFHSQGPDLEQDHGVRAVADRGLDGVGEVY